MKWNLCLVFLFCVFFSKAQEKELNYFIEKAHQHSPLLIDLKNQISANKFDSLINRATYKPQVGFTLNSNYYPTSSDGWGYDSAVTNGQLLSGLVGVNKKIVSPKVKKSQSESFDLIRQSLSLNKKIALKDLNKAITSQYITAATNFEQIKFNEKLAELLSNEPVVLKKLTQNSVYKQTDYLIFIATVKQQELALLQLKQQYQNDLALLNYLSGEVDTTTVQLKKPSISLQAKSPKFQSIFLKTFEVDSLKIVNQHKLINNPYRPTLSLLGDAGYLSSFAVDPYKNYGISLGISLNMPIYDGNQRKMQHDKNDLNSATNKAYKANFKRQYEQQLLALNQKLNQTKALEKQLNSQLIPAEALIEAHKKLLTTGDAQITEYVLAITNLMNIKNAIALNSNNQLQWINEINYWNSNE